MPKTEFYAVDLWNTEFYAADLAKYRILRGGLAKYRILFAKDLIFYAVASERPNFLCEMKWL